MLNWIDRFLNRITMYRLVLYYLSLLWAAALVFTFFHILPFDPIGFTISGATLVGVALIANIIFARVFNAQTNVESAYITAFILALIITPVSLSHYIAGVSFLFWASVLAMASKYILAIKKKHIFNPAAFAVAVTALTMNQSASWWVGTAPLLPLVFLGGLLVVRKLQRFDLVCSYFAVGMAIIVGSSILQGVNGVTVFEKALLDSPILFFTFVMLPEPLTTPPTRKLRLLYGAFVGFLFAPAIHIGSLYATPELALIVGNLFSYCVSPKGKYMLQLKEKVQIAADTYGFSFTPDRAVSFKPGQYLEWTLGHKHPDARGNRRYFTIASAPTEQEVKIGIKFYPASSSFKKTMLAMIRGSRITASQLAGEFVLPRDSKKRLVFIAGGIGITPFRSMIKYLLDTNEKREIVLLYSNKTAADIAYQDIFDEAKRRLGIKTVYTLTESAPDSWSGRRGMITEEAITEEVSDYKERMYYISGPHAMVTAFEKTLKGLGIKNNQIKIDFFPGYV